MEDNEKEILTAVSKEKFRRKLLLLTRLGAILLVLAIVWVGYIQVKYVNEVNKIKAEYGSLGYCYLCGIETYRRCECQYFSDIERKSDNFNLTAIAENTANYNVRKCENKNFNSNLTLPIFS